jgi:BirA family transcriptional regulator, biotin operon repressor / biotin---[acetyl-CoA-carboxylase] ligase
MDFLTPLWIDRVPSTNTALLEQLGSGTPLPAGTVLATDEQTDGRGRGARQWRSEPGRDLACSFVLHAEVTGQTLCSLSMAVALGVTDMLHGLGVTAQTKWPNDVTVGHRKICGILPELSHGVQPPERPTVVVVGVGLNVGMSRDEAAMIDQPATSVHIEAVHDASAGPASARQLLPVLLAALSPRLARWSEGGFQTLRPDWERRCAGLGEVVTVIDDDGQRHGTLAGFGDAGQLLLRSSGTTAEIWAGHLRLGDPSAA